MKYRLCLLSILTLFFSHISFAEEKTSETKNIGDLLDKVIPHLVDADGNKIESPALKDKDYILFYWSASWCGPCRRFTPALIDVYEKLGGGTKFEVVFIGVDKSEEKMQAYMKKYKMKWPAIDFPARRGTGIKAYAAGGIPRLMLVDKKGDIIGHGKGETYKIFKKLVGLLGGTVTSK
jgi:thiol-disulfide isomerase/thioredoxin